MNRSSLAGWILCGLVYAGVGILFGAFSASAATHRMVVAWRWAAWVVSAFVYAAHIRHELGLGHRPPHAALYVALGAALGAFGLAVGAYVHAPRPAIVPALYLWPILTALPAFTVAWVLSSVLVRLRGTRG